MTWLLDGNVLVAMVIDTHVFHERVRRWFDGLAEPFATCAVTEGTLLRVHMKLAADASERRHGLSWRRSTQCQITCFGVKVSAIQNSSRMG